MVVQAGLGFLRCESRRRWSWSACLRGSRRGSAPTRAELRPRSAGAESVLPGAQGSRGHGPQQVDRAIVLRRPSHDVSSDPRCSRAAPEACYLPSFMDPIRLLVISEPTASNLRLLEKLPEPVEVRVGNDPEFLKTHAPDADVILNGSHHGELLHAVFPSARRVKWIHVLSAGVDKIVFPELVQSPVPLTNGRGVFKDSLAEFCMASILFFAKDLRRLVSSQEAGKWEQFDVAPIRGRVLGVVGYG